MHFSVYHKMKTEKYVKKLPMITEEFESIDGDLGVKKWSSFSETKYVK